MISDHPIAIIEDRYSGTYSCGVWIAVACATDMVDEGMTRVEFCLTADNGPYGSDVEAGLFWVDPPRWVAVGNTPNEALNTLRNSL